LFPNKCLASYSTHDNAGHACRHANDDWNAPFSAPLLDPIESTQRHPPSTKQIPESTWYAALGQSIVYVWPKRKLLQLRACTCIALILILRVLNLVVPAFYGRMVDALSIVTQDARQKPPIEHAFANVFFPWVAAYLAARFLQGGGEICYPCIAYFLWNSPDSICNM
jgi:hypothetical protein